MNPQGKKIHARIQEQSRLRNYPIQNDLSENYILLKRHAREVKYIDNIHERDMNLSHNR